MKESELRNYYFMFRRWLWLVALCALLAGGTAYILNKRSRPVYQARATLLLEQSGTALTKNLLRTVQWDPATYSHLLPILLPETSARLKIGPISPGNISIQPVRDSQVIYLIVRDYDAQRATDIANTIPLVFDEYTESLLLDTYSEMKTSLSNEMKRLEGDITAAQTRLDVLGTPATAADKEEVKRLETALSQYRYNYGQLLASYEQVRLSETQSKGNLVVFKQAETPTSPAFPKTKQNTLLAAIVGAMLAVGIVFLIEYLDDTIKTQDDISRVLKRSLLGGIAVLTSGRRGEAIDVLITHTEPRSPLSEAFRGLRTNVRFASIDRPVGRLLITSAKPSEGKSLVAANLAITFAQSGCSVVLVDCDLRRPKQHTFFNIPNHAGVTDSLLSAPGTDANQWLRPTPVENLRLMTSGQIPPNPSELVGSRRMGELIEGLAKQNDVVIVDSPPVLAVTDAALLSRQVDGVLLILVAGGTREKEAHRAVEDLVKVDAPILGVVLNKIPSHRHGEYANEYYYSQYAYSSSGRQSSSSPKTLSEGFLGMFSRSNGKSHKTRQPAAPPQPDEKLPVAGGKAE